MEFGTKKIIRYGNGYAISIPREIAEDILRNKNNKVWVVIFENHEVPTAEEILKWIVKK